METAESQVGPRSPIGLRCWEAFQLGASPSAHCAYPFHWPRPKNFRPSVPPQSRRRCALGLRGTGWAAMACPLAFAAAARPAGAPAPRAADRPRSTASQPARASRFQSPPLSRRWRLTAFGARQSGQRRYRSRLSLAIVTDLRESGTCLGGAPFCVRNVHCTMRRPSHLRHSTCILYSEAQHAEPKRREWPAALAAFPPVAPLVTATTPRAHHRQQP